MGAWKRGLEEASDILVTLSEELNIIVPANDIDPAIYIDVPLDSILEVSFDKDSQQPTCGLVLRLMGGAASNCIINATEYTERHVALAFASEKDANTLRRLLMPTAVQKNGFPPHSQPRVIEISQPTLSDDKVAEPGPALTNSQILMSTASLANAIIPHSNALSTINPSRLERVRTSQRAAAEHQEDSSSPVVEHDEDPQRVNYSAAEGIDVSQYDLLVEPAFEDIDVSQTDGLSHEETQQRDTQARVPNDALSNARVRYSRGLSNGTQEQMGHFDRTSDTGPSSSLRWHRGLNAIQNAPEVRVRHSQQSFSSVEPIENQIHLEGQDGEHDDLYDASPKVKDGRRRPPVILARENVPKKLKRPLESTVQQASIRIGLPTKLSRQLRNAKGVVESHAEQAADYDLATSKENGAGDVKTSANCKKRKAPVPAKAIIAMKELIKPPKKAAQSRGKAAVTEEQKKASFDDYDFPPSPTHVGSTIQSSRKKKEVTNTQLKATKRPRNNQKQAQPVPTKAAATTSLKSLAPQLKKGSTNKDTANDLVQNLIPNKSTGKKGDDDDDAIWDVDQAHSDEEPPILGRSRQPAKTSKKQELRAPMTKKYKAQTQLRSDEAKAKRPIKAHTQAPRARLVKAKPAPAALFQPRSRRTAAIKANKKIQGLDESDEIVDDEEIVPASTRSKRQASSDAAKALKSQKLRDGKDDRPASSEKLPATKLSTKDSIQNSVSLDSPDKHRPDSVADSEADSSLEKVDLVRGAPVKARRGAPGDTRDRLQKEKPTNVSKTAMIPLHSGRDDYSNQPNATSVEKGVELSEARVDVVPDSVQQLYEPIIEYGPAPIYPQQDNDVKQGHDGLNTTVLSGPGGQNQVESALPYMDDVSRQLNSRPDRVEKEVATPQAPTASMVVELRQRRIPPRLAEVAKISPLEPAMRRDPFGAKLNASMPEPKATNTKIKSRGVAGDSKVESKRPSTPNLAKAARSSRASDKLGAKSSEEASQVENPRKHLMSARQIDGEGENSLVQTLTPAGESTSAPRFDAKRKIKQTGDKSHKRFKLAPQDRPEGVSARKRPAYDAESTPPSVVSNKPLVIGFSTTGPRNQGTVSTKKPKPPKDAGTGEPGTLELRKHDVPNPTINEVEAGFASVQEAPDLPSVGIQRDPEDAGVVQQKARDLPLRNQTEYLAAVNAVATREAYTEEHGAQKRKFAPFVDDPAQWEHEQLSKRQKRDIEIPPTVHKHHPKILPDLSPAVSHNRSQRPSSQNTRVNENGSPMPFFMTRNEKIAAEEQYLDENDGKDALAEARLEEQLVLQDDDPVLPEPSLPLRPLVSTVSISQPKITAYQSLSSNSKQVPSSPHAPSAFGMMPPHHIHNDGELVNAETRESIMPIKPQDPFVGATQNPQNSFMNALRISSEAAAKRLVSRNNNERASCDVVMRPSLHVGEDPDKTLVEPKLRKKHKRIHVSISSSSSQSGSSTQPPQAEESSEEESDAETEAKWRQGLEPHQENMLDCLVTISHVSNGI